MLQIKRESIWGNIKKYPALYFMLIPGIIWLILFRYIPFMGSVIAFQDYQIFRGVMESPWVGLKHIKSLIEYPDFYRILKNTLILGCYTVAFTFPVPLMLAIMINEVTSNVVKKSVQTILYIPHFFSWVIIAGFAFQLLGSDGLVNTFREWVGLEPILFIQYPKYFRMIVTGASIYRNAGWGTIVYLAAISSIPPEIYEAAVVDGASRLQRIRFITFPIILPTAIILLLLSIGHFMNLGFDRIFVFLTPMTYKVGDIFDTYVYRAGIAQGQYSFATAVGLFQSLVGFTLVGICNYFSKKVGNEGVF
ncbi:MAG: ABC transporter permease subunit [Spirochaetaceae bacterium]